MISDKRKIWWLVFVSIFCFIIYNIISVIVILLTKSEGISGLAQGDIFGGNYYLFVVLSTLSQLMIFLLPVYIIEKVVNKNTFRCNLESKDLSSKIILAVVGIYVFTNPFVGWLGQINDALHLPSVFTALEQALRNAGQQQAEQLNILFVDMNVTKAILLLISIAIVPAFCEEIFFRYGIQRYLGYYFKTKIFAIILSSLLFSLVHFDYVGFLPRLVLGFSLGYIYYKTENLWYSVLFHFINNAFGVVLVIFFGQKVGIDQSLHIPHWIGILSAIGFIATLFIFRKMVKTNKVENQ